MTSTLTAIKERPILFSGAMIRAILEGRKTQTRRVIKPQPVSEFVENTAPGIEPYTRVYWGKKEPVDGLANSLIAANISRFPDRLLEHSQAKYRKGDRLWLRENFYAFGWWEQNWNDLRLRREWRFVDDTLERGYQYRYLDSVPSEVLRRASNEIGWYKRTAIHMPRKASRILLEVVNVRVERLQDISEEDAIAEGAKHYSGLPSIHPWGNDPRWSMEDSPISTDHCLNSAKLAFANYWEKLNADRGYGWDVNSWVWVVEFKRVEGDRHA